MHDITTAITPLSEVYVLTLASVDQTSLTIHDMRSESHELATSLTPFTHPILVLTFLRQSSSHLSHTQYWCLPSSDNLPHTFHTPNTGAYLPQTIFLLQILQQHIINFPCNIFIYIVQSQWLQQKKHHSLNNKIMYKVLVLWYLV